jgi:hypothetical protein
MQVFFWSECSIYCINLSTRETLNQLKAAQLYLHMRQSTLYTRSGRRLPPAELFHQFCELQQIRNAEKRAMPTHGDLWIWRNEIRPLWRDRANGYIIDTDQKALSIAVVPLTYACKLPAAERMKRMRYPDKARGCDRITCISNGATSDGRRDASAGRQRRTGLVMVMRPEELAMLVNGLDVAEARPRRNWLRRAPAA